MTSSRSGSARLRLMVLLTLALLPIGVIAVVQARDMSEQSRAMSERALLAETLRAAAAQREVIRTAQGQARALVPMVRNFAGDPASCSAMLSQVVEGTPQADFAGFVDTEGRLHCTSDGTLQDLPPKDRLISSVLEAGDARFVIGGLDETSAFHRGPEELAVLEPVYLNPEDRGAQGSSRLGTIVLTLPRSALLSAELIPGAEAVPLELTTFDQNGHVLWSSPFPPGAVVGSLAEARAARLPEEELLSTLVTPRAHAFSTVSGAGERRAYAVVPVIEGEIMTLGTWAPDSLFSSPSSRPFTLGILLPLVMWALSLFVAFVSINRLILDPLAALRGRMEAFTQGERKLPRWERASAPDELQALAESFETMTQRIVADERRLEKAVHDQQVLLKEVHHRVKNNLQLIASILNMQIRLHQNPESRAVLRRVQDRVMSLATVHQHLYDSATLSALRADTLLREIVNRKIAEAGALTDEIEITIEMDKVTLYPDQAVPLALLVGEAVTNVLSHVGRPPDGPPWLKVILRQEAGGWIRLEVVNSGGERLREDQSTARAGLGMRLMEGFSNQLDGSFSTQPGSEQGDPWRLTLEFQATGFSAPPNGVQAPKQAAAATSGQVGSERS